MRVVAACRGGRRARGLNQVVFHHVPRGVEHRVLGGTRPPAEQAARLGRIVVVLQADHGVEDLHLRLEPRHDSDDEIRNHHPADLPVRIGRLQNCGHCAARVSKAIRQQDGIDKIGIDLEKQVVTVTYGADKATTQKMEEDLKEAKYPTAPYSINDVVEKSVAYKADDIHCGG